MSRVDVVCERGVRVWCVHRGDGKVYLECRNRPQNKQENPTFNPSSPGANTSQHPAPLLVGAGCQGRLHILSCDAMQCMFDDGSGRWVLWGRKGYVLPISLLCRGWLTQEPVV